MAATARFVFGGWSEWPSVRGGIPRIRPLVVEQGKSLVRNHRIGGRPMCRKNPLVGVRLPETRPTCDGSATWPFVVNVEDAGRPPLDLSSLVGGWSLVGAHFIGKPRAREATVAVHGTLYPRSRGEILHAMKHDAQSEPDRTFPFYLRASSRHSGVHSRPSVELSHSTVNDFPSSANVYVARSCAPVSFHVSPSIDTRYSRA